MTTRQAILRGRWPWSMNPVAILIVVAASVSAQDGAQVGSKNAAKGRPEERAERAYEVVSPVSPHFVAKVDDAIRTIPGPIRARIRDSGWRVQLGQFVTDAAPYLRGVHPRGWPRGTTWDHTDAAHLPRQRVVVIAEKRRNTRGQVRVSNRVAGVLRHETGHAFDLAYSGRYQFCSQRPGFRACYARDLRGMNTDDREALHYYLQNRAAGPQEVFAEAFAIQLGGGSDPSHHEHIERAFPSVMGYVRKQLAPFQAQSQAQSRGMAE